MFEPLKFDCTSDSLACHLSRAMETEEALLQCLQGQLLRSYRINPNKRPCSNTHPSPTFFPENNTYIILTCMDFCLLLLIKALFDMGSTLSTLLEEQILSFEN